MAITTWPIGWLCKYLDENQVGAHNQTGDSIRETCCLYHVSFPRQVHNLQKIA